MPSNHRPNPTDSYRVFEVGSSDPCPNEALTDLDLAATNVSAMAKTELQRLRRLGGLGVLGLALAA